MCIYMYIPICIDRVDGDIQGFQACQGPSYTDYGIWRSLGPHDCGHDHVQT